MTKEKKFSPWPFAIVGFLFFVGVVNLYILSLAITHDRGLIEENPYEAGLKYQEKIDLMQNAKKFGWNISFKNEADEKCVESIFILTLSSDSKEVISGAEISITALRPSQSRLDRSFKLTESKKTPGTYIAQSPLCTKGLWQIRVDVALDDKRALWEQNYHL